jgi:acyl-CoA dehydrogenase
MTTGSGARTTTLLRRCPRAGRQPARRGRRRIRRADAEPARERVTIGVTALATAEQAFADTLAYVKQRTAFGQPVGSFQHSKFLLAEMATEIAVARQFTDRAIMEHCAGRLSTEEASMVKWWDTELCNRVTDRCVQLHGGYGYMREYPVGRAWADSRVQSIFGGTTEIQKEIIARSLGL